MSSTTYLFSIGAVGLLSALLAFWFLLLADGELPEFPDNPYWGPAASLRGNPREDDESIVSFPINISTPVLEDLRTRLKLELESVEERVADPLEGSGFHNGFTKSLLRNVQHHWLHSYDWRRREKLLNTWPHFKTNIFGIDIHFQHAIPSDQQSRKYRNGTRPLLLLHGWPGSFVEFQKVIPKLLEPDGGGDINFEVVIPSLPGFGFSEGSSRPGLGPPEIGQIFKVLMARLGHERFYVHGGDWGGVITSAMATMYQDSILGIHSTLVFTIHPRAILKYLAALTLPRLFLDPQDRSRYSGAHFREGGYYHLQATKPESIGIGLSYSPSGLAAYLLEKFSVATNPSWLEREDGGILPYYEVESLLDNVMVYWLGRSSTTSLRIYMEAPRSSQWQLEKVGVNVPACFLNLPFEPFIQPEAAVAEKFRNIVRYTRRYGKGGHFSGLEDPAMLAEDIVASLNAIDSRY